MAEPSNGDKPDLSTDTSKLELPQLKLPGLGRKRRKPAATEDTTLEAQPDAMELVQAKYRLLVNTRGDKPAIAFAESKAQGDESGRFRRFLVQVYRDSVALMRTHGWTGAADEIQNAKAVGTLRKDNRTCALEFTSVGGQVRVTIKVTQTKN